MLSDQLICFKIIFWHIMIGKPKLSEDLIYIVITETTKMESFPKLLTNNQINSNERGFFPLILKNNNNNPKTPPPMVTMINTRIFFFLIRKTKI